MSHMKKFFNSTLYTLLVIYTILCCSCVQSAFEFQKGRRWYIGGHFDQVVSDAGKTISAHNIAFLDSIGDFYSLGNGTNGPVHTIHVDSCLNVYIGGNFSMVDGVNTGPIAKYDYWARNWVPLHTDLYHSFEDYSMNNFNNVIYAITSNCFHFAICRCDVYFGGKFSLVDSSGKSAHSLAMYDAGANKITALSQPGWDSTSGTTVHALYKKNIGVTSAISYLWVGGESLGPNIHFGRVHLGDTSWKPFPEVNGIVRAFEYKSGTIGVIDKLFVGGDFSFESEGIQCDYICEFAHNTFKWTKVVNQVLGSIYSIRIDENALYVSGNITNGVAVIHNKRPETFSEAHVDKIPSGQAVHNIDICTRLDLGCKGGSISISSHDGFLTFYNSKKGKFESFGKEIQGQVMSIVSNFQFRSNSSCLFSKTIIVIMLISAVATIVLSL